MIDGTSKSGKQREKDPITIVAGQGNQYQKAIWPHGPHQGKPTEFILYDAAENEYLCARCGWRNAKFTSVLPHMNTHFDRRPKPTDVTKIIDEISGLLDMLREGLDSDAASAREAEWKRRAQEAERTLKALRRALGHVTSE